MGVGLERFNSTDWADRAAVKNKKSVWLRGHTGTKNQLYKELLHVHLNKLDFPLPIEGCFVPSLVEIGPVVLEKKMRMWKFNRQPPEELTTSFQLRWAKNHHYTVIRWKRLLQVNIYISLVQSRFLKDKQNPNKYHRWSFYFENMTFTCTYINTKNVM